MTGGPCGPREDTGGAACPAESPRIPPDYYRITDGSIFTERSFRAVYGRPLPAEPPARKKASRGSFQSAPGRAAARKAR